MNLDLDYEVKSHLVFIFAIPKHFDFLSFIEKDTEAIKYIRMIETP